MTIHRTQKYQDGVGLTDYDSTHDYPVGGLDFIRVYPNLDSSFWISGITDEIFARIDGKSFKKDCTLPREDLCYLHVLHVDLNGEVQEGEMIVNYHIAEDVLEIFRQLYAAGYPIERIRLVDEYDADDELSMEDNNSSSFNFRFISYTTRVSKHLGLAVDINTLYNPYTKVVDGVRIVEPVTGEPYLDREADFPCKIDHGDLCYRLFIEHGFEWSGDWEDRKDYDAAISRCEATKAERDQAAADIRQRGISRREFERFIDELEKLPDAVSEFDEALWGSLVEYVTVSKDRTMVFTMIGEMETSA